MSRLLKTVFVVLVIAAFTNVSRAQDENIIRPSTKQGSAAWLFEFGGLGTLTMGQNSITPASNGVGAATMGAGFKTYLADDLALRALLGLDINSHGEEKTAPGKTSNTTFGIAVGVEMHTHDVYSTSPYFGAQIGFGSTSSKLTNTPTGGTTTESSQSFSTFGIGVFAGFDWYFTRGIAVGGEFGLGFNSMSGSSDNGTTTTDFPSASSIAIGSASVHLAVHF
jgi:hypothetical protein